MPVHRTAPRRTARIAGLTAGLALALPLAALTAGPAAAATPTPPAGAKLVSLTQADDGRTVSVHPGDWVFVGLSAPREGSWSAPSGKGPGLNVVWAGTGRSGDGLGVFSIGGRGTTTISAKLRCRGRDHDDEVAVTAVGDRDRGCHNENFTVTIRS
jgi:hypothetical protein